MRLITLAWAAVKALTLVGLLALGACKVNTQVDVGDSGGEPTEEADADADADSDADSDADGDTDADTDDEFVDEDGDGVEASEDCDDTDDSIYPGASEDCDGVDQDCDGEIDEDADCDEGYDPVDADGDGYAVEDENGDEVDCDDEDADVNPGAAEIPDNGIDDDCKGGDEVTDTDDPDDVDGDGYAVDEGDCDDSSEDVYPGAPEDCDDGLDNDCDGDLDGEDSYCDLPDDLGESLEWIRIDDNRLGLSYGYVFTTSVVASDEIVLTGDGVDEDWAYDTDNLCDYDEETDFEWSQELEDGLYRVNMRGDGESDSYWGDFQSFCQASEGDEDFETGFGPSSLCHENSDGSYSLCFIVDEEEVQVADPEDCEALE